MGLNVSRCTLSPLSRNSKITVKRLFRQHQTNCDIDFHTAEVAGSNPASPTRCQQLTADAFSCLYHDLRQVTCHCHDNRPNFPSCHQLSPISSLCQNLVQPLVQPFAQASQMLLLCPSLAHAHQVFHPGAPAVRLRARHAHPGVSDRCRHSWSDPPTSGALPLGLFGVQHHLC